MQVHSLMLRSSYCLLCWLSKLLSYLLTNPVGGRFVNFNVALQTQRFMICNTTAHVVVTIARYQQREISSNNKPPKHAVLTVSPPHVYTYRHSGAGLMQCAQECTVKS